MITDPISEERLSQIYPGLAAIWKRVQEKFFLVHELQLRVADGTRSFTEQWRIYSSGRSKDKKGHWVVTDPSKILTHSLPGMSFHNYGLAIDSCVFGKDPYLQNKPAYEQAQLWADYGAICKGLGLVWGGDFTHPDPDHCEYSLGIDIHEIQMIYGEGGIAKVWSTLSKK